MSNLGHRLRRASRRAGLQFVGGYATAFSGTAGTTTVTLTSLTGGLASQPAVGDLVVVAYCVTGTSDLNVTVSTSGYTELADVYGNDDHDANLGVYQKYMSGSADTSVDVGSSTGSGEAGAVAIHVWRNANSSTPIDVATTTANGSNSFFADPPSITPSTAGAVILAIGAGAGSSLTMDPSTAYTSSLDNLKTACNEGSTRAALIGLVSTAWTSGAYDPAAFGANISDNATRSWAAATVAIRPA